jgi:hypothetical protein
MSEDDATSANAIMTSTALEEENVHGRIGAETVRKHTSSCAAYS